MSLFDISVQTIASIQPLCEPGEFVTEFDVTIRRIDEDDRVTKVGKARAYRVEVGQALDDKRCLFDVFDDHSDEM